MNNWIYLILIAVLAILAVVMLYSRFAVRSREKSSHHAPIGILFSEDTISVAPLSLPEPLAAPALGEEICSLPRIRSEPREELPETPRVEPPKNLESDYLDELQEAAAGLALLMRSSPIERVAPVTFAPDAEGEAAEETPGFSAVEEPILEDNAANASVVAHASEDLLEKHEGEDGKIVSVREILGEHVLEIVDRIDFELDALHTLVAGIEASLVALGGPVSLENAGTLETEEEERVSEAA